MSETADVTEDMVAVGIDVGERQLHIVGLNDDGAVTLARVIAPDDVDDAVRDMSREVWIAIDAPDKQRRPRHLADEGLSRRFRSGRCAEIALGRRDYWVPWVTLPEGTGAQGWMQIGFNVWQVAQHYATRVVEVYPHAAFRVLACAQSLPKKETSAGTRRRWSKRGCEPRT
jgi:predicted nuclease with RNAse H fold